MMRNLPFINIGQSPHGLLLKKQSAGKSGKGLHVVFRKYLSFVSAAKKISVDLSSIDSVKEALLKLTELLNDYRSFAVPILESRINSGQENLRSSILEEFFSILCSPIIASKKDIIQKYLVLGKGSSFVSLSFAPGSFENMFSFPNAYIHKKDQDFVLGCKLNVNIDLHDFSQVKALQEASQNSFVIPALVIECKTYIERNMLDSCAGTAKRLKTAMPYCLYLVAAEYMKMEDAFPELTDINEVFILTKASNSERMSLKKTKNIVHGIQPDLVFHIFCLVNNHLNRIWWSPKDAVKRGCIIDRPF